MENSLAEFLHSFFRNQCLRVKHALSNQYHIRPKSPLVALLCAIVDSVVKHSPLHSAKSALEYSLGVVGQHGSLVVCLCWLNGSSDLGRGLLLAVLPSGGDPGQCSGTGLIQCYCGRRDISGTPLPHRLGPIQGRLHT